MLEHPNTLTIDNNNNIPLLEVFTGSRLLHRSSATDRSPMGRSSLGARSENDVQVYDVWKLDCR